jgi:hypothetical protein
MSAAEERKLTRKQTQAQLFKARELTCERTELRLCSRASSDTQVEFSLNAFSAYSLLLKILPYFPSIWSMLVEGKAPLALELSTCSPIPGRLKKPLWQKERMFDWTKGSSAGG